MPRHNYDCLSHQDFEELVRDLLQAEWNVTLEAFKSGRDNGIDLRYSCVAGDTCIIQCKHFATSGFSKLLSELRIKELPKIQLFKPSRYIVATTCGLSPANKDDVVRALAPYVLSPADVIGANDLDGLLARHPVVERANFKLWLTSTEVLERVLHNAELCLTDFQVDRVRRKLPLFVRGQAFPRAQKLLEEHRIVVISGVPGIGKTTLAEMLLYSYLDEGYEPVIIQSEIAEGRKFFRPKDKQIFYYDDFLGETFLGDRREYLGRNQDAAIVDFMEMVARSPESRFILTTREHILSTALMFSERLNHSQITRHQCVLELGDYSTAQRARILYNHLYFSDLPPEYCDEMLRDDFFLSVIKHDHFNPRIIEWLASYTRLHAVPATAYQQHVTKLLESPESIWAHAYNHQISDAARHALISFYTLGQHVEIAQIEPAFLALHRHAAQKYNRPTRSSDFRQALQELDGAFLSYQRGRASFINPSVRDFLGLVISDNPENARDVIASAIRFRQVSGLWELAQAKPASPLMQMFRVDAASLVQACARLQYGPALQWEQRSNGAQFVTHIDVSDEGRIGFFAGAADVLKSAAMMELATKAADHLIGQWTRHTPGVRSVLDELIEMLGLTWFFASGGKAIYRKIVDSMMDELHGITADECLSLIEFQHMAIGWTDDDEARLDKAIVYYVGNGASEDIGNCSGESELFELRESMALLHSKHGIDLGDEIDRIDEEIAKREERSNDLRSGGGGSGFPSGRPTGPAMSDDEVRDMFRTLRK